MAIGPSLKLLDRKEIPLDDFLASLIVCCGTPVRSAIFDSLSGFGCPPRLRSDSLPTFGSESDFKTSAAVSASVTKTLDRSCAVKSFLLMFSSNSISRRSSAVRSRYSRQGISDQPRDLHARKRRVASDQIVLLVKKLGASLPYNRFAHIRGRLVV